MKKTLKITGIIVGALVLIFLIRFVQVHIQIKNGDLIKWDNKWYTKEELKQAFPPQYIEVPAKNTPEEVYAAFRQALLDNDIEKALGEIREQNREEYRQAFQDKEKFDKWVKSLPEKLTKENEYGNFAYYDINYETEYKNTVSFLKNSLGYWQIDNI